MFFSLLSLFVVPALKTQITGGRCWLPLKDFCTLHVVHSFIIISFYSIIIFCLRCDLISLNSSDWLSNHIRCNYLSLSLGADKRPSRIQMQTLYHLSVFFARQALWRCLYVCGWVCLTAYVHVSLTGCLFTFLIPRFENGHMFIWNHENRQCENLLYSLLTQHAGIESNFLQHRNSWCVFVLLLVNHVG